MSLGPNLRFIKIQASYPDLEHTSGLCGSFDRDKDNDFSTFRGQQACPTSANVTACVDFVKSWRLATEQSLFAGSFGHDTHGEEEALDDQEGPGQCSCSSLKKPKDIELRPKTKPKFSYPYDFQPDEPQEEESDANKCTTSPCVDPRGVDVTHQLLELVLDEDFTGDDQDFVKHAGSMAELPPAFTASASQNQALKLQTRRTEWSEDEAEVFCRGLIEGMPATKLCRDVALIDIEYFIKECKKEVMVCCFFPTSWQ